MNVDRSALSQMSLADLARLYNEVTGESVRKFADRKSAVRRVLAALDRVRKAEAAERPSPLPARAKAAPSAPAARKALEFPASPEGRAPRPGTKRAALVAALRSPSGVSAEEAMERFGWTRRDLADALRLAAKKNGVAVREDGGRYYGQ